MISVMALSNPSSTTAHATLPLCLPARATLFPYTTLFRSADAVVSGIGLERALFEAPRRAQQAWLISHYGPNVNLGNISDADALSLETLRLGLRPDTMDAPFTLTSPDSAQPAPHDPVQENRP